jgi:hypothetical protein
MATTTDLSREGFVSHQVQARTLNIAHHDPINRGPFCRLIVVDSIPEVPGVCAWTTGHDVKYIGMSGCVRQVVQGAKMGRAYNDYTYIPLSSLAQLSSPRVRVNGLLNRAFVEDLPVKWRSRECESSDDAARLEARYIGDWNPAWNRARPSVRQ